MQVTFFSNHLGASKGHGIQRYASELLNYLRRSTEVNVTPVTGWYDRDDVEQLKREIGLRLTGLGRQGTRLAWTFLDWPAIEDLVNKNADLIHAASLGYPIATRKPFVVTIHDLGPLTHPHFFSSTRPWVMERALAQAERKADQIICVSQSTADEVCEYIGAHIENRITVVHEAASSNFKTGKAPLDIPNLSLPDASTPYILMAGKISPRKNVQGVLKAISAIADQIPHHLVLVGGDGWDMDKVLDETGYEQLPKRVHRIGFVTEEQLVSLYQNADIYVHPSLYEGFGLTILEAMSCGVPVITSNTSSLPEVAGDAALLVDPDSVEETSQSILKLSLDASLRTALSHAGVARAKKFSWQAAAAETIEIYQRVRNA